MLIQEFHCAKGCSGRRNFELKQTNEKIRAKIGGTTEATEDYLKGCITSNYSERSADRVPTTG